MGSQKPFDIVWLTPASADAAMRALYLPPEEEWRVLRAKANPFRMWLNCPVPDVNGEIASIGHCVTVARQGAIALHPGRYDKTKNRALIFEHLEKVVEQDGFTAGYIKPEVWELPEFKKEAKQEKEQDDRNVLRMLEKQEEARIFQLKDKTNAIRRYLLASATLARINWRTPNAVLQDICLINKIEESNQREVEPDDWMRVVCPSAPEEAEEPYDVTKFPSEAMQAFALVGEHNYDVKNPFEQAEAARARSQLLA